MGRSRQIQMRLPDENAWRDLKRDCKLDKGQCAALRTTLEEIDAECRLLTQVQSDSDTKKALAKLDGVLDRLTRVLTGKDVTDALRATETHGLMGFLISASAVAQMANGKEDGLPVVNIERLLTDRKSRQIPVKPSDLDALSLQDRQRQLNDRTSEVMGYIIEQLRQPIARALELARQDKGGNRPKLARELLIFLLARDAEKIIGQKAKANSTSKFAKLCVAVTNACGIDDTGHEEALRRCLKKFADWLEWYQLPEYSNAVGILTEEQILAIPDDPEPRLK